MLNRFKRPRQLSGRDHEIKYWVALSIPAFEMIYARVDSLAGEHSTSATEAASYLLDRKTRPRTWAGDAYRELAGDVERAMPPNCRDFARFMFDRILRMVGPESERRAAKKLAARLRGRSNSGCGPPLHQPANLKEEKRTASN